MDGSETGMLDVREEMYGLFRECYPGVVLSEEYAKNLMTDAQNVCFEERREGELVGLLLLKENVVLMFCVAPGYRGQGIGSELLSKAEKFLQSQKAAEIKLCEAGEYITPGAPLYPGNREFFEKRGYVHEGAEDRSVDMMMDLADFTYEKHHLGDTIEGITYRYAQPEDREGAVNCAGEALPEFAQFYYDEKLYQENSAERVIVAVKDQLSLFQDPAESICGVLLVNLAGEMPGIGSLGCTSVRPSCAGKGIATNMVRLATGELRKAGLEKGYLSYTYGEIVPMYARSGYQISMRYFMGKKALEGGEEAMEKKVNKEVVIQYMELEGSVNQIEERIYEQFRQKGNDVATIEKLEIYIKPQDFTAYYVINDTHYGKVAIF